MDERALQPRVREVIVDAFSVTRFSGSFESLVAPTKSFGVRGGTDAEAYALRLAIGAAKAVDELAAELDRRSA